MTLNAINIGHASNFLESMAKHYAMDRVEFDPDVSIAVAIPVHREWDNIERLFNSWQSQNIPKGVNAAISFFINNKEDPDKETYEENKESYEYLRKLAADSSSGIDYHVIDAFSKGKAIPRDAEIGYIRNFDMVPIVRHAIRTKNNILAFNTDADTFPSSNLLEKLHDIHKQKRSVYGTLEREVEFSDEVIDEKQEIEDVLLIGSVHDILLEYFAFGEWNTENTFGGPNTFYTVDNFVKVGGYKNMVAEDADLGLRLKEASPSLYVEIEDAFVKNTIRFSDRVIGDGDLLKELHNDDYRISFHAQTTLSHASFKRWITDCMAYGVAWEEARQNLKLKRIFPQDEIDDLSTMINKQKGDYKAILQTGLHSLYKEKYTVRDSLRSYAACINTVFGEEKEFDKILKSLPRDELRSPCRAFIIYASRCS